MKVVINKCYGGFGLSPLGIAAFLARKGKPAFFYVSPERWYETGERFYERKTFEELDPDAMFFHVTTVDLGERISDGTEGEPCPLNSLGDDYFYNHDINRCDPDLIAVVEELGEAASGRCGELAIIEIPDDVEFRIEEYDGLEWVAEKHRTWS